MEMFCSSAEESINALNLAQKNYLHLLVPQLPDECYCQSTSEDQTDLHYIKTLPLLDQIRIIMKQGKTDIENHSDGYKKINLIKRI